ncbi:hypothetical protein GE061_002181 [Apolygus lucorum]|uniref:Double jelly roll-like domain-containing protein n=1 Tax=Apolygus lucorum TaxID=248454 RepID=A0A6A4IX74_APOLU|nr:hypothetical protein GE061_002181 [Apolygus lucorum]
MASFYEKYDKDIIYTDYKRYAPVSTEQMNTPDGKIEFNIDFTERFAVPKFEYYISGKLVQKASNADYETKSNIKLTDNFVAYLFSHIVVSKHGRTVQEVLRPGITSTIKSIVSYKTNDLTNILQNNGYVPENKNKFCVSGQLSHLGLSFFEHVKIPFDKGGFNITFTRNSDSPCIFRWKSKKTDGTEDPASLPQEGRIVIEEFYIRVPMIDFDKNDKVLIMQDLTEKKIINWNYRKWHCVELPNIGGKDTIEYNVSHLFTKGVSPIFVLVAFQTLPATIGAEGQLTDNSILTPMNVKNDYHVTIDDESYPRMRQDFNTGYALAYNMYCDYMKTCVGGHDVLYSPNKFITDKCVYVIDTSKQVKNITSSAPNITVNVDFSRSVPDKTHMYIIAVSQSALKYDVLKDEVEK